MVAGRLTVKVLQMRGGPEYVGMFSQDKLDPYIKITLHDGKFDLGKEHMGESMTTSKKNGAGGNTRWDEEFVFNKPENMDCIRVQLFDSDVLYDDCYGSIDVDLDQVVQDGKFDVFVPRTATVVKQGKTVADVDLEIKVSV